MGDARYGGDHYEAHAKHLEDKLGDALALGDQRKATADDLEARFGDAHRSTAGFVEELIAAENALASKSTQCDELKVRVAELRAF